MEEKKDELKRLVLDQDTEPMVIDCPDEFI